MKKFLLMLSLILGASAIASAKDSYVHDLSVLPKAALTTIADNFRSEVSVIKVDKIFGFVKDYEVTMSDGTEITFDRKGNWDNIETGNSRSVPASFIPAAISRYVAKNQPGTRIVGVDKERNGYEIELSNGVDIKFDKDGQFVKYDM